MDHLHDPLFSTISEKEYPLPEFVKTASDSTPSMYAFFNGIEHFFPISNPSQAYLSKVYFEKNAFMVPEKYRDEVALAISDACEVFQVEIEHNIEKIATQKDALTSFMGDLHRFENFGPEITAMEKRAAAENLVKRASEFDDSVRETLNLPEKVKRYAGTNLAPDWKKHIDDRIRIAPDEKAREHYRTMLNDEEKTERMDPMQLAKLVEFLDNRYELRKHYDRTLSDPLYSMMSHEQRPMRKIVIIRVGDRDFHDHDFAGLEKNHLSMLKDDVADRILEKRDMHELPEHVKDILAGVLNAIKR